MPSFHAVTNSEKLHSQREDIPLPHYTVLPLIKRKLERYYQCMKPLCPFPSLFFLLNMALFQFAEILSLTWVTIH